MKSKYVVLVSIAPIAHLLYLLRSLHTNVRFTRSHPPTIDMHRTECYQLRDALSNVDIIMESVSHFDDKGNW